MENWETLEGTVKMPISQFYNLVNNSADENPRSILFRVLLRNLVIDYNRIYQTAKEMGVQYSHFHADEFMQRLVDMDVCLELWETNDLGQETLLERVNGDGTRVIRI